MRNMNKGREVGDNIFESSKLGLGGFGRFGGFGFGRSMIPSIFGDRDPFDDPFFSDPFDRLFGQSSASRTMQKTSKEKGVVIEELASDEDDDDTEDQMDFDHKISRSTMEPSVEHPDDDVNEKKNNSIAYKNDHYKVEPPKARNFSYQTSRVTYGGVDGAFYTSSRTRRTGSDGAMMEESREADTTTGQASHRISRGIHDKGHSLLRKLDSDGKVDTTQTLHNLDEDELEGFEEAWKGNKIGHFQGWNNAGYDVHSNQGSSGGEQNRNQAWPLPLLEQGRRGRGFASNHEPGTNSSGTTKKKVVRINIE